MHMFNPGGYWTNEFSADEQGILETDIAFLTAFILLLWAGIQGSTLYQIGRLHMTFKLFIGTIVLQIASLVFLCILYGIYGKNGVGVPTLIPIGRIIAAVNEILFLLLLMLLAKGWTVVRGRLTEESQLRLIALMVMYTIAYAIMFIWEAKAFDPAKVIYVYDSPAGYGIAALSFIAFCWFVYAVIVTAKKNPDKQRFYVQFCSVYSLWLLSRFIVVMVSNSYLEDWYREKVVNGINLAVAFAADVAFMIFTRPYGSNFPFHLKPSQVSVDLSESGDPEHPYAPSSPVSGDRSIELFQGKAPFSRSSSENREGVPLPKTDREIQAWSGHVPTHLFRATQAQQDSRL
ncbi:transmembrane protein 145-like [Oscarella lobularis]|uniref:transmembrane protein 145-like n=1 Tax=Oscarella lobularis TaxID=121494 RepID=UPI003313EBBA